VPSNDNCANATQLSVGGWGFRFGGKKGKAIVMSSGYGVVITQKSGKKFTITTQRKLELERVIDFWMNENEKNG